MLRHIRLPLMLVAAAVAFQSSTHAAEGTSELDFKAPKISVGLESWTENTGFNFNDSYQEDGFAVFHEISMKADFQNNWYMTPTVGFNNNNNDSSNTWLADQHYVTLGRNNLLAPNPYNLSLSAYVRQYTGSPENNGDASPLTRVSASLRYQANRDLGAGWVTQPMYYWKDHHKRKWRFRNIFYTDYSINDWISAEMAVWYTYYDFNSAGNLGKHPANNPDRNFYHETLLWPSMNFQVHRNVALSPYVFYDVAESLPEAVGGLTLKVALL